MPSLSVRVTERRPGSFAAGRRGAAARLVGDWLPHTMQKRAFGEAIPATSREGFARAAGIARLLLGGARRHPPVRDMT